MTGKAIGAEDVLGTFSVYQPKTVEMVAEDLGIDEPMAERLLSDLEARNLLTRARGGTACPVWIRRYQPAIPGPM